MQFSSLCPVLYEMTALKAAENKGLRTDAF